MLKNAKMLWPGKPREEQDEITNKAWKFGEMLCVMSMMEGVVMFDMWKEVVCRDCAWRDETNSET